MSFVKVKDKWRRVIAFGVGTVLPNANGEILTITEPSSITNTRKLIFKANGASRKLEDDKWQKQLMNFGVWENNPLSAILQQLKEFDTVFVYGVLEKSPYTSQTTGKKRNYYEVKLEYIKIIAHGDGTMPIIDSGASSGNTDYEPDPDGDIPF